jgi:hypothetical protein
MSILLWLGGTITPNPWEPTRRPRSMLVSFKSGTILKMWRYHSLKHNFDMISTGNWAMGS